MQVDQTLFNVVITVAGLLGGWVLNTMWGAIKDGRSDHAKLADKVSSIEVLVAGKYVTRDEFNRHMGQVDGKLDAILEKMDNKADKH